MSNAEQYIYEITQAIENHEFKINKLKNKNSALYKEINAELYRAEKYEENDKIQNRIVEIQNNLLLIQKYRYVILQLNEILRVCKCEVER